MKRFVNILTLSRILATFILPFIWLKLKPIYLIILVFLILISDFLDGLLARTFKVQSLFGSVADVIADKLFGLSLLIMISSAYNNYYWVFAMETLIALINIVALLLGAKTKSSFIGKAKMWILGFTILIAMLSIFRHDLIFISCKLPFSFFIREEVRNTFVYLTFGAQIMVAIDYLSKIIKELIVKKPTKVKTIKEKKSLMYVLFDTDYYLKHQEEAILKQVTK